MSDRNAKAGFEPVGSRGILKKLSGLRITTWYYTNAPGTIHCGLMAQDFKAAFGLGSDDKHIATVDADGVAFAAIQALHELEQEKEEQITALHRKMAELVDCMAVLEAKMRVQTPQSSY